MPFEQRFQIYFVEFRLLEQLFNPRSILPINTHAGDDGLLSTFAPPASATFLIPDLPLMPHKRQH